MAKQFIEPDYRGGGNNASDGLSFGNRKTDARNGIAAAAMAPGDTLAYMASPTGSLAGCSLLSGTAALNGSTDTFTQTGHGLVDLDLIVMFPNASAGVSQVIQRFVRNSTSDTFQTSTTRTGGIDNWTSNGDVKWGANFIRVPAGQFKSLVDTTSTSGFTAQTDVTLATNTAFHDGRGTCILATIAAGYAAGNNVLLYVFGSDTDLSSYSAVNFTGLFSGSYTGTMTLKFYSDASGTTEVGSLTTPSANFGGTARFSIMFQDATTGAALPSTVRSIALILGTDPGANTIYLGGFVACHDWKVTPNAVTPWSTVSSIAYGDEWFDPSSTTHGARCLYGWFSNTSIPLHMTTSTNGGLTSSQAWCHTAINNGTVYITHHMVPPIYDTSGEYINEAGTGAAPYIVEGGYSRSDMATRTGITIFRFFSASAPLFASTREYVKTRHVGISGGGSYSNSPANNSHENIYVGGYGLCRIGPASDSASYSNKILAVCSSLQLYGGNNGDVISHSNANTLYIYNGTYNERLAINTGGVIAISSDGNGRAMYSIGKLYVRNSTSAVTRTAGPASVEHLYLTDVLAVDASPTSPGFLGVCRYNGTIGDCRSYGQNYQTARDTTVVYGTSTASYKITLLSNIYSTDFPRWIQLFDHEWTTDPTGATITVAMRLRKSSANINARLCVSGGMIVATRQCTDMTAAADTWEQVAVSFTASAQAMLSLWIGIWSTDATSSVWADFETLSITRS